MMMRKTKLLLQRRKILEAALATLSEIERDVLMTYIRYQEGQKHLPDQEMQRLCDYHKKTSDNVRQIKKRAMDKVKVYIQQNSELSF